MGFISGKNSQFAIENHWTWHIEIVDFALKKNDVAIKIVDFAIKIVDVSLKMG